MRPFGGEAAAAVAELAWRVSDEPGETRAERKAATYPKIRGCPRAVVLKLADRLRVPADPIAVTAQLRHKKARRAVMARRAKSCKSLLYNNGGGGTRTPMRLPAPHFERSAEHHGHGAAGAHVGGDRSVPEADTAGARRQRREGGGGLGGWPRRGESMNIAGERADVAGFARSLLRRSPASEPGAAVPVSVALTRPAATVPPW
jgi:hypothetical protein